MLLRCIRKFVLWGSDVCVPFSYPPQQQMILFNYGIDRFCQYYVILCNDTRVKVHFNILM